MTDIATLTAFESATLHDCEQVIERGLNTFVEVGTALASIRDSRLYRGTHRTFEDYAVERWNLSRAHAYRMIAAAEVVSPMGDIDPPPTNERQVRELAKVPEPERAEVWRETVERTDGSPTAAAVREAAEQRRKQAAEQRDARALLLRAVELLAPANRSINFVETWIKQLGPYDEELSELVKSLDPGPGRRPPGETTHPPNKPERPTKPNVPPPPTPPTQSNGHALPAVGDCDCGHGDLDQKFHLAPCPRARPLRTPTFRAVAIAAHAAFGTAIAMLGRDYDPATAPGDEHWPGLLERDYRLACATSYAALARQELAAALDLEPPADGPGQSVDVTPGVGGSPRGWAPVPAGVSSPAPQPEKEPSRSSAAASRDAAREGHRRSPAVPGRGPVPAVVAAVGTGLQVQGVAPMGASFTVPQPPRWSW